MPIQKTFLKVHQTPTTLILWSSSLLLLLSLRPDKSELPEGVELLFSSCFSIQFCRQLATLVYVSFYTLTPSRRSSGITSCRRHNSFIASSLKAIAGGCCQTIVIVVIFFIFMVGLHCRNSFHVQPSSKCT